MTNRQFTSEEHEAVFRLRCALQAWGFAADEIPADELLWTADKTLYIAAPYLLQGSKPYGSEGVRHMSLWVQGELTFRASDGYGTLVALLTLETAGTVREEVSRTELMPAIWRAARKTPAARKSDTDNPEPGDGID